MSKLRGILVVTAVLALALGGSALAQGKFDNSSGALYGVATTTSQTAVFAAFLSASGPLPNASEGINTTLSVSNVLATPNGFQSDFINLDGGDTSGQIEVWLWNEDGELVGAISNFVLDPGQTAVFDLRSVLDQVGFESDRTFLGYGWVIGSFDGIAGTYTVQIPGVQFSQNFELLPGVGQGQTPTAGLPLLPR